ncbi:SCO family protein [Pusillimonas sp.]|uniref:SCO family protein n=1 Tax=Pusillimonas sp. TaxID=3040095 RepID=UPI0037C8746D
MSGFSFPAALTAGALAAASITAPALGTPYTPLAIASTVLANASNTTKDIAAGALTPAQENTASTAIHRVRGFLPNLRFSLTGPGGQTVTEDMLEDKVVLLFFGYASCPDICPTTMAQLSMVIEQLGDQADKAQIVFISVDPHRDTPDILNAYVSAFNDHAIGLTGSEKQIADIARRYRVAYQIEKPTGSDPENYEVTHARGIYIFDQEGRARFLASDSESIDSLTASVRELLG